ncbi:PCNA-interacting partner-like isoform X2 [Ptychodera flava]|uniref:PCNA-interacting partner-like isoform X2 n=1 Tax=Ptychodera flava TaxID=63121 RepID=UPI00396A6CCB
MKSLGSAVYYIPNVEDCDIIKTVCRVLQLDNNKTNSDDVIILNSSSSVISDSCHGFKVFCSLSYIIELYRRWKLGNNERETVLSYEDYLITIQLTLAEFYKQECGDFDVETSEVLQTAKFVMRKKQGQTPPFDMDCDAEKMNQIFTNYNEFLKKCNSVDFGDVYQRIKIYLENADDESTSFEENCRFVIIGDQIKEYEQNLLKLLFSNQKLSVVTFESPLDMSLDKDTDVEFSTEEQLWSAIHQREHCDLSPQQETTNISITELHIRRVVFAYLGLVINSRNEIALARCLNTPDRELNHQAFTALKRMAREKNMPVCQTAVSFVMRVRLGGHSYKPNEDNPLAPYIKGLGEFVDVIQKLQTIIEEDPNARSAMRRILKVIKAVLYKSNDQKLRKSSVDAVMEKLHPEVDELFTGTNTGPSISTSNSPALSVANGGSIAGRVTVKTLRSLLDRESCQRISCSSVDILTDSYSSQKTPLKFPSLLSQFRSPDVTISDEPENKSLKERIIENKSEKSCKFVSYKSCMSWADEELLKEKRDFKVYQESFSPVSHNITPSVNHSMTAVNQTNTDRAEKRKELKKRILEEIGDDEISDCDEKDDVQKNENKAKRKKKDDSKDKKVKKAKENKTKTAVPKQAACRTKKQVLSLQKGQKQLTDFFRM